MRLDRKDTVALIIDIQEKLVPAMKKKELLLKNSNILVQGLNLLEIPLIYTQQYTKGLGMTVDELIIAKEDVLNDVECNSCNPFLYNEKITFSCYQEEKVRNKIQELSPRKIIIAGIETHICVMQTVRDLLHSGYEVMVVTNCVSSRKEEDMLYGLKRMEQEGAVLGTYESVLFELMESAEDNKFKEISKLIK